MSRFNSALFSTILMSFVLLSPAAMAHKVNLFAYAEGMEVFVEGYFVDGKAAQNSTVKVYGGANELMAEGVTNDEGQYQFSLTDVSDLKIILNAGMGHQAEFILLADDLGLGEIAMDTATENKMPIPDNISVEPSAEVMTSVNFSPAYGAEDVKALVFMAVKEANKPLVRELSAAQEKASLSGLLGGIGYIVGVLGLFAFFKAKQMVKESK